jgi:hypothetical protein
MRQENYGHVANPRSRCAPVSQSAHGRTRPNLHGSPGRRTRLICDGLSGHPFRGPSSWRSTLAPSPTAHCLEWRTEGGPFLAGLHPNSHAFGRDPGLKSYRERLTRRALSILSIVSLDNRPRVAVIRDSSTLRIWLQTTTLSLDRPPSPLGTNTFTG